MCGRWRTGIVRKTSRRRIGSIRSRRVARVLVTLALLGASSCYLPQLGNQIELEVVVAPQPAPWERFGPLDHLIVAPAAAGGAVEARVAAGQGSVRLKIEKRTNVPVLDYPLLAGRRDLLKPAGAVYPIDLEKRGRILTSYRDGFLAELLVPVSSAGELLGAVNVRRLRREIWERSNGDPWQLDREAILQTLLFGIMRSDRIRARPCFDLSLEANPGTWACGDPFFGQVVVDSDRSLMVLEDLPIGAHHFLRVADEMYEQIDLQVNEAGWEWMNAATGCGGYATW